MFNNNFGNLSGNSFADNSDIGGLGSNNQLNFSNQNLLQSKYEFGAAPLSNDSRDAISIEVRKVYLGATRPQAQQQRRTYDVTLTGTGQAAIENAVDRYGLEAFAPNRIGDMLAKGANFISHSGTPDDKVDIDNGWESSRFRFTMVVDVFRAGQFQRTEFISGYTNHDGVTNMGMTSVHVDPNMVFTINHVTEARARHMDAYGRPVPMISRSNAVVRNSNFIGMGHNGNNQYLTRPSDVLRAVDKVQIYQGMEKAAGLGDTMAPQYQDLDSMLTHVPMMSADTNLLIPTFSSRTFKGLLDHSLNKFDPMNMDGQGSGSMAAMNMQDTAFTSSGLVHVMNRIRANGVGTTAQFTYGDLIYLDPTIDARTDVFGMAYTEGAISIPDGRSVAAIGDAEKIAVHATSIAQTTLALMSLAGVATLAYTATNMETGDIEVTLQACDGLDTDGMLANRLENLKMRLKSECLNIVAVEGAQFTVDVFCDAFNDAFIKLYWEGVSRDYVIPSYASSSLAPIVTKDLGRLVGMAEAIDQVVDVCKRIVSPNGGNETQYDLTVRGNGEQRYAGLAGDF